MSVTINPTTQIIEAKSIIQIIQLSLLIIYFIKLYVCRKSNIENLAIFCILLGF